MHALRFDTVNFDCNMLLEHLGYIPRTPFPSPNHLLTSQFTILPLQRKYHGDKAQNTGAGDTELKMVRRTLRRRGRPGRRSSG
jgi:hypothetical protein